MNTLIRKYITYLDRFPEDIRTNQIPEKLWHHVQIRGIQQTHLEISVYDLLHLVRV